MRNSQNDYAGLAFLLGPGVISISNSVFPMHSNHIVLGDKKVKYSIIGKQHLR